MSQSPNSLYDHIRIADSNLQEICVTEYKDHYYVTESGINNFKNNYGIIDTGTLLESVKEFNNINSNIIVLSESNIDESLEDLYSIMIITESLNPFEVKSAIKNKRNLKNYIVQAKSYIKKREYDKEPEVQSKLDKCNKILLDIEKEKKAATLRSGGDKDYKTSAGKFTLFYVFNIAKTVFTTFILPGIIADESLSWPSFIETIFEIDRSWKRKVASSTALTVADKIASLSTATNAALKISKDAKKAVLSITDYVKLLNDYEKELLDVKHDLEYKLEKIKKDKLKVEV